MIEDEVLESTGTNETSETDESTETFETTVVFDEPVEVILVDVTDDRNIMTTAFSEYTVTEGLLLLIFVVMLVKCLFKLLKEGFLWLLS